MPPDAATRCSACSSLRCDGPRHARARPTAFVKHSERASFISLVHFPPLAHNRQRLEMGDRTERTPRGARRTGLSSQYRRDFGISSSAAPVRCVWMCHVSRCVLASLHSFFTDAPSLSSIGDERAGHEAAAPRSDICFSASWSSIINVKHAF